MQSLHDFLKTLSHNHLFIPIKYAFASSSQTCHKTCRYISTRKYHQTFTIWTLHFYRYDNKMMMIVWCLMRTFKVELMLFLFTATQTHNIWLKCGQRKHWQYFWGHFSTSLKYLRKKGKHENIISTKTMRDSAFLCKIRLFNQLNQPVIRARKWTKTIAWYEIFRYSFAKIGSILKCVQLENRFLEIRSFE